MGMNIDICDDEDDVVHEVRERRVFFEVGGQLGLEPAEKPRSIAGQSLRNPRHGRDIRPLSRD